jgi:thiol-disulfide isomerase/thioredoxin
MHRLNTIVALFSLFVLLALCAVGCRAFAPPIKWNAVQVEWQGYEAGMARARAENKPILLVFYANWCGPCKAYSRLFEDPRVVAQARDFVMVHVNVDDEPELKKKYRVGGTPHTHFLLSNGTVLTGIRGPGWQFSFDVKDPGQLLEAMGKARKFAAITPPSAPGVDPSEATAGEVCTAKSDDPACLSCLRTQCCEATVACRNGTSCICRLTCRVAHCPAPVAARCGAKDEAYTAMNACLTDRCAKECLVQ